MSLAGVYLAYIACHLGLLGWTFNIGASGWRVWWIRVLLIGVLYDNSMILLSILYNTPDWLHFPNTIRWVMHSMILPVLTLYVWSVLKDVGADLVAKLWAKVLFFGFTAGALGYGLYHEIIMLELTTKEFVDPNGIFASFTRFVDAGKGPPMATIMTNLFALPWAIYFWRKAKWPWLFAGSITIFIINGASAASAYSIVLGNFAEILFILSLIVTERFMAQRATHL